MGAEPECFFETDEAVLVVEGVDADFEDGGESRDGNEDEPVVEDCAVMVGVDANKDDVGEEDGGEEEVKERVELRVAFEGLRLVGHKGASHYGA